MIMLSRLIRVGVVLLLSVLALPAVANAQLTSPNYSIDEVMIGTGGDPELCSTAYCAQQSTGGTSGQAESTNFGLLAGFGTPDEPSLAVSVTNNDVDLGVLNTSSPAAASANFTVSSYLSSGYIVRINGDTPTNETGAGTHSLDDMDGAGGSIPGVEQFGINLRANTNPGIGTNPVQYPDSSFSYGTPTTAYNQVDIFKYQDGDIIAESTQETGQTQYTMSIIANVATSTPGGRYQTVLVIQAIATF
jgi:hypothetical protein